MSTYAFWFYRPSLWPSRFRLTCNTAVSLLDLGIGNGGSYTCKNSWIYYHIKGLWLWLLVVAIYQDRQGTASILPNSPLLFVPWKCTWDDQSLRIQEFILWMRRSWHELLSIYLVSLGVSPYSYIVSISRLVPASLWALRQKETNYKEIEASTGIRMVREYKSEHYLWETSGSWIITEKCH